MRETMGASEAAVKQAYDTADAWYADPDQAHWRDVVEAIRPLLLEAGLDETVKWGQPCYTDQGKNIAIVGWMKGSAILSFFKGALLTDPGGRFEQAGSVREARYLPYQTVAHVEAERGFIGGLIREAVEATRAGRTLPPREDLELVEELQQRIHADPAFREAWAALTPGRKRGFNIHFGKAKKSATRVSRIEAALPRIMAGKGIFECACGLSKRPPRCDGSHKQLDGG